MNDKLRLFLIKKSITKKLKSIILREFIKFDDPVKFELFTLFRYLTKER